MKLFKRTVTFLLFLILINVTAVYFLAFHKTDTAKVTYKKADEITKLLREKNITLAENALPESFPDLPHIKMKNAAYVTGDFARRILGEELLTYDYSAYTTDTSSLSFSEGEFTLTFKEKLAKNQLGNISSDDYGKTFKKALTSFGFDTDKLLINVNLEKSCADVFRTIDGLAVFDDYFTIYFSEDEITKICGIWYEETDEKYYKKRKTLTGIIREAAQNKDLWGRTVTDISFGYKCSPQKGNQNEVFAYPVLRITVDDKDVYDYII